MADRGRMARGWLALLCSTVLVVTAGCARPANGSAAGETLGPTAISVTADSDLSSVMSSSVVIASTQSTSSTEPTSSSVLVERPSVAPGTGAADETSTAAALPDCTPAVLATRTPGVLTIATGQTPMAPWFTGPDPATSDGYEAAVARDVAAGLGFPAGRVDWVKVDTQKTLEGSTGGFDFLIDRVRVPKSGSDILDFSTGYYAVTDSLVMLKTAAGARPGAPDLTKMRLGAMIGSTGENSVYHDQLTLVAFMSGEAGLGALAGGSIDGLLMSTPDALAASQMLGTLVVVGQLPPTGQSQPDQFHLVLAKNSPLAACVSAAVDRLRIEGTLEALTEQWITGPLAPELG